MDILGFKFKINDTIMSWNALKSTNNAMRRVRQEAGNKAVNKVIILDIK
jgi:hypothetical protein